MPQPTPPKSGLSRREIVAIALCGAATERCAVVSQVAQAEGLIDATGKVRIFQTFLFMGQGVLAAASLIVPGVGALRTAVSAGQTIIAAIQAQGGKATATQIADMDTHTATINDIAAPHVTVTINTPASAA